MPYDVDIGDGADALGQNQLSDALAGTYWVSGWDATLGTGDLEVDIAAGDGAVDGTDVSTASTQTIDFTGDPDGTDPRKAVIYVDSGGTVQKSLGTPQPVDPGGEIRFRTYNPSPPASVSGVVVAEVWLAAAEAVLESADVRDRRVSNDAVDSVEPEPNVPNWQEDGNSPATITDTNSVYTLANNYDTIMLVGVVNSSTNPNISIRPNEVSTADYDLILQDGSTSTNQTEIPIATGTVDKIKCEFDGVYNNVFWGLDNSSRTRETTVVQSGQTNDITSPVNTIEFINGGDAFDITLEVYGRNIG